MNPKKMKMVIFVVFFKFCLKEKKIFSICKNFPEKFLNPKINFSKGLIKKIYFWKRFNWNFYFGVGVKNGFFPKIGFLIYFLFGM
ncbi:MAG: hypothetical protein CM15mP58_13780 [Burkholderiaceae bacterium]|nr:MAG: hypothetical protein CM15mP58_13780 [Burkholderiaceae bacterium]